MRSGEATEGCLHDSLVSVGEGMRQFGLYVSENGLYASENGIYAAQNVRTATERIIWCELNSNRVRQSTVWDV